MVNFNEMSKQEKNKFLSEKFRIYRKKYSERKIKSAICKKHPELKEVDPIYFKSYPSLAWIILIQNEGHELDEKLKSQYTQMYTDLYSHVSSNTVMDLL